MTEDPRRPSTTPDDRIADEHAQLGKIVHQLESTTRIEQFAPLLTQLREFLVDHFEMEEGQDGLRAVVRDAAPNQIRALDGLFEEHLEILRRLDAISDQVEAARLACESVVAESGALIALLRDHEDRENELIIDAINRDIGGGD